MELKNNLKQAWWRRNVYERDDMEGLDASVLTHRLVLHYSGHEATFADPWWTTASPRSATAWTTF